MAIDTARKRFSAINPRCAWRGIATIPTGTVDGSARQALANLYNGLASGAAAHPTVLADLTPAAAAEDVIDHDEETNGGSDVTMGVDGTYVCDGGPDEYFITRLFDDSEGDWHVMSGVGGYRVYVGGTVRIPDQEGETPANAETTLESLGLVVTHTTGYSSTAAIGEVARTDPPKFSLVNDGQTITVIESLGPFVSSSDGICHGFGFGFSL